jgi:protein-tyrosine phosphatase/arsenate reductase
MIPSLKTYCDSIGSAFDSIPVERKAILDHITQYLVQKKEEHKPLNLVYVCTHNSRRSHFGQVWAKVAARYYNVKDVHTFSGGTEVTAFNINAIHSLQRIGFEVQAMNEEKNTLYHVFYDLQEAPIVCFSKVYNDVHNPSAAFAAIMTCSDAEQNCPFIPGVELRIATPYDDPKAFDATPLQDSKYDERCKQIATETFYVFSKIN